MAPHIGQLVQCAKCQRIWAEHLPEPDEEKERTGRLLEQFGEFCPRGEHEWEPMHHTRHGY